MKTYKIDPKNSKIIIGTKELHNDNMVKISNGKLVTVKDNKEVGRKVSSDITDSYKVGDTYISPTNIAYYCVGDDKWVKVGQLKKVSNIQKNIATGYWHTLFLLEDGTVKACGSNNYGQLGDGTTTIRYTPVLVSGVTNCVSVSAGGFNGMYSHSLFLLEDGTVKACGYNNKGQLGTGDTSTVVSPVTVSGVSGCIGISAGDGVSIFLLSNGTVKAVGNNSSGQLGDGTATDRRIPVLVSGVINCIGISAGSSHSLFLLADGTVKACGRNDFGQLGDGTTTPYRITPVTVSGVSGCIGISAGYAHSLFLLADGTVKACGRNDFGQLGDGTTTDRSTPRSTPVLNLITNCVMVMGGIYHSLFLLSDGTVKSVGRNTYGQLGDGTTTDRSTPVLVSSVSGCIGVISSFHSYNTFFLLADNTLKVCGFNQYHFGDGTTTQRNTPVLVPDITCKFISKERNSTINEI